MDFSHLAVSAAAGFSASLVEAIEALTVVLAVGAVRGWRSALTGTGLALAVLVASVLVLGPGIARIPIDLVHLVLGTALLLFGLRWLRKAVLRVAGVLALRDEAAAYARASDRMRKGAGQGVSRFALDGEAVATAFKITVIEGVEVIFIVLTIGAGGGERLQAAAVGALAALLLVTGLGALLHRPITRVPENALKYGVGVLLAAFGTFWAGEGIGIVWPGDDWALGGLVLGWLAAAWMAGRFAQGRAVTA